jgi:hypothetical protein
MAGKEAKSESVKVYVRVRPFLQKKLVSEASVHLARFPLSKRFHPERLCCWLLQAKFENGKDNIVKMEDPTTYLLNPNSPEAKPLQYTFDASLWSHCPGLRRHVVDGVASEHLLCRRRWFRQPERVL